MRDVGHMQRHLSVETWRDGKLNHTQPIHDPFITTTVVMGWSFFDWLKMLFRRKREVKVMVRVRGDSVAICRWFQAEDVCEKCGYQPIGQPHDGTAPSNPGYHHGEERWCEACYYSKPIEKQTMAVGGCAVEAKS